MKEVCECQEMEISSAGQMVMRGRVDIELEMRVSKQAQT